MSILYRKESGFVVRRTHTLTPVELLTVSALREGPVYGYALVERIEKLSGGRVKVRPGNLYRVLHRLEAAGLATEVPAPEGTDDERRQYFVATEAGRRAAAEDLSMYARVLRWTPGIRDAPGRAG